MKKIVLNRIDQVQEKDGLEVQFYLTIGDTDKVLKYDFTGIDCQLHTIAERFDPIAILFLHYALRHGFDMESNYPISEELYYTITNHVIPHLYSCNKEFAHQVTIHAPLVKEKLDGDWHGAGVSCGIDSLASIYEYHDQMPLDDYKLTHLVYLKVGQHAEIIGNYVPEEADRHFQEGLTNAVAFCKEIGIPLVVGESNFDDLVTEVFGAESKVPTFTYRNLGSIMILQNHFSKYFYASSYGDLNHFEANLNGDVGHYERWLIPLISTDSLKFYSASKAMERIEKTEMISHYPSSYNHLSVCWRGAKNCSYCRKCIRTMVTLDLVGGLDNYSSVFNLDMYYRNRKDYLTYIYLKRKEDFFYGEIAKRMEEKGQKPNTKDYISLCRKKLKARCFPYVDNV